MKIKWATTFLLAAAFGWAQAFEWKNVGSDERIGGRMVSAGYLRGKVVLIDRRDYGDKANFKDIKKLQEVWSTYKCKPFILIGSHVPNGSSRKRVEKVIEKFGLTYPVYADAQLDKGDAGEDEFAPILKAFEDDSPHILVIDPTCRRALYNGGGDVRGATGVIPNALFGADVPSTAEQYAALLDWEITHLPGRAYLRLKAFRSQFPTEAQAYDEQYKKLAKSEDVKRLAKIVELSRLVKDRDASTEVAKRITKDVLEKTIEKYDDLKQNENEFIAQEAKNALADLKWAQADVKK